MWINSFKLAVIKKDIEKISNLLDEIPKDLSLEQMQEASAYISEALKLLEDMKFNTSKEIVEVKKKIEFIKSSQKNPNKVLDIKL